VVILSWIIFKNFTDSGSYAAREIIFMINNPRATYDQKMELKVGKQFYNYVLFVKNNTPEDSTILIPPFPTWPWAQTGNIPYMTYFLYPRTLLNGKEYTPGYDLKKDDIDFVLVAWGELAATPGSRFRLFSILAAQAAQVMPSTGRSRRSVEEEPMGAAFGRIFDVTQTIYPGGVLVKYPQWV